MPATNINDLFMRFDSSFVLVMINYFFEIGLAHRDVAPPKGGAVVAQFA